MIYKAAFILPISNEPILKGYIGISEDGEINYIGDKKPSSFDTLKDLGNCILMPGFVNAHSHIEYSHSRGLADGKNLWDWIETIGYKHGKMLSLEDAYCSALDGAQECLKSGITCLGDSSFFGASVQAIEDTGIRGIIYFEIFGQSAGDSYVKVIDEKLDKIKNLSVIKPSTISFGLSPHSIYTSDDNTLTYCAKLAADGLPIAMHLAETDAENDYSLNGTGNLAILRKKMGYEPMVRNCRAFEVIERAGLLRDNVCLAHCVSLNPDEISKLVLSKVGIAHCPRSNAFLGTGIAYFSDFINYGASVGLGTDSSASSGSYNFFEEMRFSIACSRQLKKDAGILLSENVVKAATIGSARALGLGNCIGSLEVGKKADMIAFDISAFSESADPYNMVVLSNPKDIRMVVINGQEKNSFE